MLDSQAHERKPEEGNGRAQEKAFDLTVTADDYLEKIFQVPFWIRPLSRGGCKNLVAALTSADSRAAGGVGKQQERSGEEKGARDQKQDLKVGERKGEIGAGKTEGRNAQEWREEEWRRQRSGTSEGVRGVSGAACRTSTKDVAVNEGGARVHDGSGADCGTVTEERETIRELLPFIEVSSGWRGTGACDARWGPSEQRCCFWELSRDFQISRLRCWPICDGWIERLIRGEWAKDVAGRLKLTERAQWNDVMLLMDELKETAKLSTIRPLARAADLVDRFTFSPTRSAVTGI